MKLASTLTTLPARRPRRTASFYDVYFVVREPDGRRSTPGGALRYVPSAWALRSYKASGDAVWFRAERRLALMFMQRLDGLKPRRAKALHAPAAAIGAATLAAQRALGRQAVASTLPAARASGGWSFELALIAALGTAALVAGLRRRHRRSSFTAPSA